MENKKKALICGLCMCFVVIGLIIIAAVATGVILATRPQSVFTIVINSTISSGQTFTNGYIFLKLALPSGIQIQGSIHVYLDGVEKFSLKSLPTIIQIPTTGLEDGEHIVSIAVVSQDNRRGYGEITILVEDPRIALVGIEYPREIFPGILFMITVEISGSASHMVANYSSLFGYSFISTSTIQKGPFLTDTLYIPTSFIPEELFRSISLVVYSTEGRALTISGIEIFFQSGETNPFTIDDGIIDMRVFPLSATTDSALNFTLPPSFDVSITTGQSVEIPIAVSQDTGVSEILVGFEGYGQHFIIPITSLQNQNSPRPTRQTNSGTQTLVFTLTLPIGSITPPTTTIFTFFLQKKMFRLKPNFLYLDTSTSSLEPDKIRFIIF